MIAEKHVHEKISTIGATIVVYTKLKKKNLIAINMFFFFEGCNKHVLIFLN
jgi:hypothetical protein